ncbi:hypothetical protein DKY64_22030, partial [Stenotrophomonas maltophilia]
RRPLLASIIATLLVAACGGGDGGGTATAGSGSGTGGGTDGTPVAKTVNGVFLDAAVEGLDYVAGNRTKAQTGAKGEFVCEEGQTVQF